MKQQKPGKPKPRRARGSGSIYQIGGTGPWWVSYRGSDGKRIAESSESHRTPDAQRLLDRPIGAKANNLPVIPHAERLTFAEAAQAVIHDFTTNAKRRVVGVTRRVETHLAPYFGQRRLVGITTADVTAFIAHRQAQGIVAAKGARKGERIADVSNAEINRELALLKRTFSLAIQSGRIATKPHIPMLRESSPPSGFFEAEHLTAVLSHVPAEIRPVIEFAGITG